MEDKEWTLAEYHARKVLEQAKDDWRRADSILKRELAAWEKEEEELQELQDKFDLSNVRLAIASKESDRIEAVLVQAQKDHDVLSEKAEE